MPSGNILALGRGLYYAYPSCTNLPPVTGQAFWLSVNGVDDNNRIIEAIPAGAGYKYFYKARKTEGSWSGWNKYLDDSDLVVSQIDISPYKTANIVGTTSICYLQKYGKMAVITIGSILLKYQTQGSNIIFTIPGYAPLQKTAILLRGSNGNTYAGFAFGDSSMSIQLDNLPTGDLYVYGQFTVVLK